jgi:hypothetical protein
MPSKVRRVTWLLAAVLPLLQATAHASPPDTLRVFTPDGTPVPVQPEKLQGLKTRPLAKLKETLDHRFGPGFLSLLKLEVQNGTELIGRCTVTTAPVRLTVYEISRRRHDPERTLRVVATKFFATPGETGEFRTRIEDLQEDLFFVTAEQVDSAAQLDSHLTYMNSQDNAIAVTGFSTNWNLSVLKVNLAGRDEARQEVPFTKDAEWLVDHLIRPLWVTEIRVVTRS